MNDIPQQDKPPRMLLTLQGEGIPTINVARDTLEDAISALREDAAKAGVK